MAAGNSKADELLKCNICLDKLKSPRALPCLHSFCEVCLDHHIKNAKTNGKTMQFSCPTCRKTTLVPQDGATGFPKDFRINQFSDILDSSDKQQNILTCDLCASNQSQAVKYCAECVKYFCHYCSIRHRMSLVLKSHTLTNILPNEHGHFSLCKSHHNEPIRYFCQSCDTCICILCLLGNHEHHLVASIQDTKVCQKDFVLSCLKHVENQIAFLNKRIFSLTCTEGQSRGQYYEAKFLQSYKLHIKARRMKPLENLNGIYKMQLHDLKQEKDLCFQYLEQFKMIKQKLENITVRNADVLSKSYSTILEEIKLIDVQFELSVSNPRPSCLKPTVNCTRTETKEVQLGKYLERGNNSGITRNYISPKPRTLTPLDFCLTKLSSLSIQQKPYNPLKYEMRPKVKLLFKVGGYGNGQGYLNLPFGIDFDKDDNLIVAENGSGRIQKFNLAGRSTKIIEIKNGYPRCICIGKHNEIYFTDENTKCIKMVEKTSEVVFNNAKDKVHFPYGITTLQDGHIVISDKIYEKISILKPNGEVTLQFGCHGYTDSCLDNPSYLATDGNNILVSDSGHHQIKFFDKHGNYFRKIGSLGSSTCELRYPKGIAVTRKGEIIVADSGNHRVIMFSKAGDNMTTLLDGADNIERPIDVAWSPSGLLAVAMPDKHIVLVYNLLT